MIYFQNIHAKIPMIHGIALEICKMQYQYLRNIVIFQWNIFLISNIIQIFEKYWLCQKYFPRNCACIFSILVDNISDEFPKYIYPMMFLQCIMLVISTIQYRHYGNIVIFHDISWLTIIHVWKASKACIMRHAYYSNIDIS